MFSTGEMLLYALIKINDENKLITWNFETLIQNLNYSTDIRSDFKLPLAQNNLSIFQN